MTAPAYRIVQIDKQTGDGLCIAFYDDRETAMYDQRRYSQAMAMESDRFRHVAEENRDHVLHGGR